MGVYSSMGVYSEWVFINMIENLPWAFIRVGLLFGRGSLHVVKYSREFTNNLKQLNL